MDPRGLVVTKNVYFSLLPHTKQLLLLTLYDMTAETEIRPLGGPTDMKSEVVIYLD